MVDLDQVEIILAGRLNGKQRNKLKGLLNMMYKPSELADEIGINVNKIYTVYIPGGCPYERDSERHILINGQKFKIWFEEVYAKRGLNHGEAFCLTCKRAVPIIKSERKNKDGLIYDLCNCPNCGRKLTRIVDNKKKKI
jgi:hypothetical protein